MVHLLPFFRFPLTFCLYRGHAKHIQSQPSVEFGSYIYIELFRQKHDKETQ